MNSGTYSVCLNAVPKGQGGKQGHAEEKRKKEENEQGNTKRRRMDAEKERRGKRRVIRLQ